MVPCVSSLCQVPDIEPTRSGYFTDPQFVGPICSERRPATRTLMRKNLWRKRARLCAYCLISFATSFPWCGISRVIYGTADAGSRQPAHAHDAPSMTQEFVPASPALLSVDMSPIPFDVARTPAWCRVLRRVGRRAPHCRVSRSLACRGTRVMSTMSRSLSGRSPPSQEEPVRSRPARAPAASQRTSPWRACIVASTRGSLTYLVTGCTGATSPHPS